MKYIKKITPQEMNDALKRYFDVATKEDFWEVKGFYARPGDLCYASVDDNCYYCLESSDSLFVYWAMEQGRMSNIRGLFEVFYQLICEGYPFIRINGRKGRYPKILKAFNYFQYVEPKYHVLENEEIVWYAGHPENVEKIKRRFE